MGKNKWRRPENMEFPIVWFEFQAKNVDNDDLVTYRVQDLPEDRYDDAVNIIVKYFLPEEPICNSLRLYDNPKSLQNFIDYLRDMLEQKIVVVCFREGSDEIVGVNFIGVTRSDDDQNESTDNEQEGFEWMKAIKFIGHVYSNFNPFEYYGVDTCITSISLLVVPKYRNRGIAKQILLAREYIGRKMGIPITATIFTAKGSQKCSHSVGFTVHYKISFEELSEIDIHFPVKNMKDHIEYSSLKFNI